jgi:Terminase large subunit, T4likevirus-type, N-terminal
MSRRTDIIRALDPVQLWRDALQHEPDAWQATVLRSPERRIILNATRQGGKSSVVACKALHMGLYQPNSLILLVSRSLRQSGELAKKIFDVYQVLGKPVPAEAETKLVLALENGSRIVALPGGDEGSLRGFSGVRCLIIDEASRCPDALYVACRPMVAVSGGSIILLSTPFGRRGFFHQVWAEAQDWLKIQVTAEQCPRLSREFLAQERRELGARWFAQEYGCQFVEAVGQMFSDEAIEVAFREDIAPLFPPDEAEDALFTDVPPLFGGG